VEGLMTEKSSIHFEKIDASFAKKHNSRAEAPTYLLPQRFWRGNDFEELISPTALEALHESEKQKRKARHARGATPTLKNSQCEAVLNLDEHHTLADVKRVAKAIEERFGFTAVSLAVHRDEGHVKTNEKGQLEAIYNLHAHIVFYTMKNGIAQRRKLGPKELEEVNSLVAKTLGMTRGESKTQRWERVAKELEIPVADTKRKKTETPQDYIKRLAEVAKNKGIENFNIYEATKPRKHLKPKEFRQVAKEKAQMQQGAKVLTSLVKEAKKTNTALEKENQEIKKNNTVLLNNNTDLKKQLLTLRAQKEQVEAERKKYKGEGDHVAEEYRALQALNKTLHTQKELDQAIWELRQQYEKRIAELKNKNSELTNNNTVLSKSNQELKTSNDELIQTTQQQKKEITELNSIADQKDQENRELQQENQNLKAKINSVLRAAAVFFKKQISALDDLLKIFKLPRTPQISSPVKNLSLDGTLLRQNITTPQKSQNFSICDNFSVKEKQQKTEPKDLKQQIFEGIWETEVGEDITDNRKIEDFRNEARHFYTDEEIAKFEAEKKKEFNSTIKTVRASTRTHF